jgi:hypothetical protein
MVVENVALKKSRRVSLSAALFRFIPARGEKNEY